MPDINSRNHFYLGREHDLSTGETTKKDLLYKSKDLTTHAVCVGMTGSGKTGLCVSLLEEAALDGIPAIIIDPKGDLGNLMLGFPKLEPKDFRPWVDESVAERKGKTPDEFSADTAELWKKGLGQWGQGADRIQQLNDAVERVIFTPGASHGIPMTVLKSFDAPPKALRDDLDSFRQRISSSASGLLALLGIDADPVRSREHILLSNVLKHEWEKGRNLAIADMIQEIIEPPFDKIGVMELESVYPKKERTKLAMDLNNLLASPSFAGWMEGQPLDVASLFRNKEGKPRQAIISIAHLDDAQRMFFVTILLNEVIAWMRTQPGTGSLRALLYMDEVFGYFPPTANPPSKQPMLLLLKQARAFGLGCVLATQNPVDLDYKGLSNAGTWFLGRLQTERDKMRVMEGLEGASAQAGNQFDKQAMERTLAGVGSRVFLMNNVHDDQPTLFHTRWAMSYLAGPLAMGQIKTLMDPIRDNFVMAKVAPAEQDIADEPDKEATEESKSIEDNAKEEVEEVAVESQSKNKELAASIEKKFKVRIRDANAKVKSKWNNFLKQLVQVPVQMITALIKLVVWVIAKATGAASKRKGNSVSSASMATLTEFTQASGAWSEWKDATNELWDVKQEQEKALSESANREELTLNRPNILMWTIVAMLISLFLLMLIVGMGLWLLSTYLPKIGTDLTSSLVPNGAEQSSETTS